jgi:membrane dipeptidase
MSELSGRARELLARFPLIDGHNDLPWALRERAGGEVGRLRFASAGSSADDPCTVNLAAPVTGTHTDLPRLAAGGVGAQFWSVYVPSALASASFGSR